MGKITGGLNKMLSGNLGGLVFVQMNGETYVRTLPIRKKDSWSDKQKLHRKRFQSINQYCTKFKKTLIPQIWNLAAAGEKMSGYHLFLKANMPAFGSDGSLADATKLRFSEGKLLPPYRLQAAINSENDRLIDITWENDPKMSPERLKDELMLITRKTSTAPLAVGSNRAAKVATFEINEPDDHPTEIYLYFAATDKKSFSPDQCIQL